MGVGSHALLQGIFLTQWWNPCFLHLLHWQADSLSLELPGLPGVRLGSDEPVMLVTAVGAPAWLLCTDYSQHFLSVSWGETRHHRSDLYLAQKECSGLFIPSLFWPQRGMVGEISWCQIRGQHLRSRRPRLEPQLGPIVWTLLAFLPDQQGCVTCPGSQPRVKVLTPIPVLAPQNYWGWSFQWRCKLEWFWHSAVSFPDFS